MTDRLYSANEMAIACAKRLSGEAAIEGHWTDIVAEHGIEITDPEQFTIVLESGQRFEVHVVDKSPAGKRIEAPGCTGLIDCPAELHVHSCLGVWITDEEKAAGVVPDRDVLARREREDRMLRYLATNGVGQGGVSDG